MADKRRNDELIVVLHAIIAESITFISLVVRCFLFLMEVDGVLPRRRHTRRASYRILPSIPRRIEHLRHMVELDDVSCINNLRMSRHAFARLCVLLESSGSLRTTKYVTVKEQVAMFLLILGHHTKNRIVSLNFIRSGRTVSKHFNSVLAAVLKLDTLLLSKPTAVSESCNEDRWSSFQGCLGALDGTYIKIKVPLGDKARYRNRKGEISVNVLGVCDRELNFIYVLTGWEGSAADSRVLRDAISRPTGLRVPRGNYYLADCGYANAEGFLMPYKGHRYHLQEWIDGTPPPRNKEELFNLKHARARNVIERAFGLLKGHWAILRSPSFYPPKVHNRIILACCLLHNYIRKEMPIDPLEVEDISDLGGIEFNNADDFIDMVEPSTQWNAMRESIANAMWQSHRGNN